MGVPIRYAQRSGASGRIPLWEDKPALLQQHDGGAQPGPAHRAVWL